jgi:hypothetical protein
MREDEESWKDMILKVMRDDDSFDNMEKCTIPLEELSREFYTGYGGADGTPFLLWTKKYIYFPAIYDGAEWVERIPRDPCDIDFEHVGGW